MFGVVKEDCEHDIVEGYSINGIPVHKESETIAENNIGKEVQYELNFDGYRSFGAFTREFYKKAKIISVV